MIKNLLNLDTIIGRAPKQLELRFMESPASPSNSSASASAPRAVGALFTQIDEVNHPAHYTHGSIEAIDVIEDWGLGYHLGNALKYICRAGHKGATAKDLRKAAWYLTRKAEQLENE